jgi:methionyl-tRNA synthetase
MLFALGLPLPRRIWVLPNVSRIGDGGVDARDLVKRAGKDAVRFYLASSATSKAGSVELSHAGLVECYEGLRTLVNGLIDDLVRYSYGMEGIPLEPGYFTVADAPLESMLSELPHLFARRLLDDLDPSGAISSALLLLTSTRSHLVSSFGKSSSRAPERTAALVQLAVESLRVVTILLDSSVVPGMFEGLLERLGVGKDERTWNHVLAKRIGVAGELIRMDLETMKVEALRETIPWTEDEVD